MNHKLEILQKEAEFAQRRLQNYMDFLARRDQDPDFMAAKSAFEAGWRIQGWTWCLTDTDNEVYVWNIHTQQHFYFADGVNRDTDEAIEVVGITDTQAEMLSDLCEELGISAG